VDSGGKAAKLNTLNWSVRLDARLHGSDDELIDAADALLETLAAYPEAFGPTTAVNLRDRVVASRFDVEATDFGNAVCLAGDLGTRLLTDTGFTHATILHAEIDSAPIADESEVRVPIPA